MSTANTSYQPVFDTEPEPAVPAWKAEVNARLAAHRERRPTAAAPREGAAEDGRRERPASASLVAARVAERYAKAPSYSEFLAASAAAAAAAAETAAFAARQAQDAAEALAQLTAAEAARELEYAEPSAPTLSAPTPSAPSPSTPSSRVHPFSVLVDGRLTHPQDLPEIRVAPLFVERGPTVEHPEPLPPRGVVPPRSTAAFRGVFGHAGEFIDAFADAMVPAAISLPAKLIEFPRELIAAHRTRPRIAEGPLVEELPLDEPASPALRIFEVQAEIEGAAPAGADAASGAYPASLEPHSFEDERSESQGTQAAERARAAYSAPPAEEPTHRAPAWHSIRLGEHPASEPVAYRDEDQQRVAATQLSAPILHTATLGDRTMAALVDVCLVGAAFALFVLVFVSCTTHPPAGRTALVCGVAVLGALLLFYEWLFMSFGAGTPGMRYARLGICTFDDENPTRSMMRKRVAASALSALSLGLGFLWALFDEDALTWHDRMTRTYQRSCR